VTAGEAALKWAREARQRAAEVRAEAEAAKRRALDALEAARAKRQRIRQHKSGRSN
jgi:hypothetical protein